MRKSRKNAFACAPYPVDDHSVHVTSPYVQCADQHSECTFLQDQQDWNQDKRKEKGLSEELQIQKEAKWEHGEYTLYRDANCAFRFPNLEQTTAPAICSVPVQKKHRE
jgi:hypothetical protein